MLDNLITGLFGDGGSSAAIRAQTNAAKEANATQKYIYDSQRAEENQSCLRGGMEYANPR